jgi:hypothetical protein
VNDFEPWIGDSLARVYPLPPVTADWEDVLERARVRRRYRTGPLAPKRVPRKFMLAFALAVTGVAVLLTGSPFRSSPAVLERAAAALESDGRILHIVDRWGDGPDTVYGDSWQLPDGSLDHVIFRSASGAVGADCVISATQARCWNRKQNVVDVYRFPPPDPGYPKETGARYSSDWPASLQRSLASGEARLLGPQTFDGKAVYAILLAVQVGGRGETPRFVNGLSPTLYVDRQTYLPVAEYADMSTRYFDTFAFLSDTAANRKAVELSAPADAKVVVHPVGVYPPGDSK